MSSIYRLIVTASLIASLMLLSLSLHADNTMTKADYMYFTAPGFGGENIYAKRWPTSTMAIYLQSSEKTTGFQENATSVVTEGMPRISYEGCDKPDDWLCLGAMNFSIPLRTFKKEKNWRWEDSIYTNKAKTKISLLGKNFDVYVIHQMSKDCNEECLQRLFYFSESNGLLGVTFYYEEKNVSETWWSMYENGYGIKAVREINAN